MINVVGIDLGTTRSAVAIIDEFGRPRMVHNREGSTVTPSYVLFKGQECVVGERAKRAVIAQSENVACFAKRHMCEPDWEFVDGRGISHRPEEISALILKKLKSDAEHALGRPIDKAVITVPYYFQDMERNRTKTAGELAGIEVLRIINEPTAAAIAYGLNRVGEELKILVYDFGGGTFDVTIMEVKMPEMVVLASGGDRFLGGVDLDETLVEYFKEKFVAEHNIDPLADLRTYQDFYDRAEQAKIDLSFDTEIFVGLSAMGKTLDLTLTRETFNELISHYIDRTMDIVEATLKEAGLNWSNIDRVLLVGGSTRIPLVQERIRELSGKEPEAGINPDEVVAMGAAIVAAVEVGEPVRDSEGEEIMSVKIQDVTAHGLGIDTWDEEEQKNYNNIFIPKNTPIPAKVTRMYTTIKDNQTAVRFTIYEGEDRDPKYCTVVGEPDGYILDGIPPQPRGVPKLETTLEIDREGIIHLTAVDKGTGKVLKVDVKRPELLDEESKKRLAAKIKEVDV